MDYYDVLLMLKFSQNQPKYFISQGNVGCTCDKSLVNKYNLSLVRNSRNESSIFDQINLNPMKSTVFVSVIQHCWTDTRVTFTYQDKRISHFFKLNQDCSQTSQTSHLCENFTCVVENIHIFHGKIPNFTNKMFVGVKEKHQTNPIMQSRIKQVRKH